MYICQVLAGSFMVEFYGFFFKSLSYLSVQIIEPKDINVLHSSSYQNSIRQKMLNIHKKISFRFWLVKDAERNISSKEGTITQCR